MRRRELLLGALLVVLAGCAGPEDPGAAIAAQTQDPPAALETETEAEETGTMADGRLDFNAVAGTWRGQVKGVVFGQKSGGGSDWVEIVIDPATEKFAAVGTHGQGTTSNEPTCSWTLVAVDSEPPVYTFRLTDGTGVREDLVCPDARVRLIHDPGAGTVEYKRSQANLTFSGTLARSDG